MLVGFKHRKFIQYSLVTSTLLIQIVILIFFYNEYFNENKLAKIKAQMEETNKLKRLTNSSKQELVKAQNYLYEYLNNPQKEFLDFYFQALRNVTHKIDSAKIYETTIPLMGSAIHSKMKNAELENLVTLIDSIYQYSGKLKTTKKPVEIKEFQIDKAKPNIEIEQKYVSDSVRKKKFFPRLKDALKGNTATKTDTVYISTKVNSSIDTNKIKNDVDSTFNLLNEHYLSEVKNYQKHLSSVQSNSHNVYNIYNNLISLSNNLIDIYDVTSNDLGQKLEQQYNERFSKINKIRRYTVFGLMLLLFFVLIIMAYYTKLSFLYEQKLKEANDRINSNLKFKNRILGMLSHEIRSPLKIVTIFINRIAKKTTDESTLESLKSMRFTNDSLLIQANQILDYTKNQDKEIELIPVKFNLYEEIESLLNAFQPYIESVNNTLENTNEVPKNLFVFADKVKIHQIFINLLGNANKFTENGTISVHIKTTERSSERTQLCVTIADTGIGISENDMQKIFEPYYKGAVSEEVENLGAGLGLNLCKEIIELFQGNISVQSELGKGTSINFEINLAVIHE
ncbi:MAG TPA: HAMP domain-containing sensor histidine kinase [Crocinitomicaceae bacterium]|nr:HAMP domain-containing sensor histidine kinase [Crocinitomicaceae bacterium]